MNDCLMSHKVPAYFPGSLKIPADAITTPIVSQSKFSRLSCSASLLDCISFGLFIFRLLRLIKIFQLLFALPIRPVRLLSSSECGWNMEYFVLFSFSVIFPPYFLPFPSANCLSGFVWLATNRDNTFKYFSHFCWVFIGGFDKEMWFFYFWFVGSNILAKDTYIARFWYINMLIFRLSLASYLFLLTYQLEKGGR